MRIACIALAGTVGAVGMLGYQRGGVTEPFAAAGYLLARGATRSIAVMTGVAVHALWIAIWSALAAAFMRQTRGQHVAAGAFAITLLALGASFAAPHALAGALATLSAAERIMVHVVLLVSLIMGMRLAPRGDGAGARRVNDGEDSTIIW